MSNNRFSSSIHYEFESYENEGTANYLICRCIVSKKSSANTENFVRPTLGFGIDYFIIGTYICIIFIVQSKSVTVYGTSGRRIASM